MIGAIVIADSGDVMARLTGSLHGIAGLEIVRHANGRGPVASLVLAHRPDVVIVGTMTTPALAMRCVEEICAAGSSARIIVLTSNAQAAWLGRALHAGAAAVVPGDVDAATLARVLRDVLKPEPSTAALAA